MARSKELTDILRAELVVVRRAGLPDGVAEPFLEVIVIRVTCLGGDGDRGDLAALREQGLEHLDNVVALD